MLARFWIYANATPLKILMAIRCVDVGQLMLYQKGCFSELIEIV